MTTAEMTDAAWFDGTNSTFGDRLAGAREAAQLSQSELARRAGVKLTSVKAWEDDRSEPRANTLQRLSGILGVSLIWLLSGEGDGAGAPGAAEELPEDLGALLGELRAVRADQARIAETLGRLEKRLRLSLAEGDAP